MVAGGRLLTTSLRVSQSCCTLPVDDGEVEHSLHFRLVETRKHCPGGCWLHIGGGQESTDKDSQSAIRYQVHTEGTPDKKILQPKRLWCGAL